MLNSVPLLQKIFCDSWLFSHPLTGTLKQILSLKLQHLGAACSSEGRANRRHCFACLQKLLRDMTTNSMRRDHRPLLLPQHHQQWITQVHVALCWLARVISCEIPSIFLWFFISSCAPVKLNTLKLKSTQFTNLHFVR